jgi:hypothetical protein
LGEPVVPLSVRKKEKSHQCEIIRLKASPAAFIGIVYASDEKWALAIAIEQFHIRPVDQPRLLARLL